MNPDIKLCLQALSDKSHQTAMLWRYYDGDHPVVFTNPKWSEVFPNTVPWTENLCQVVCNVTRDRLHVQSWNCGEDAAHEALEDAWKQSLRKTARAVHLSTIVTGHGYLVAWPDAEGRVKAYYHDPGQVHVLYEDSDPDAPRVGCKTWSGTDDNGGKVQYLNLYYADRIEHYAAKGETPSATTYLPLGENDAHIERNEFGMIPVFHFRLDKRSGTGELTKGMISLQDRLNKLTNDLMVSSEYSAFAQRWAIGNFDATSKIPVGPGVTALFPASDGETQGTQVGTFATSPPSHYLEPMESTRNAMAKLSATPKHYFLATGGDPSGEALAAMESPLIAKVEDHQEALGETWEQVGAFVLRVKKIAVEKTPEVIWQDPHTQQPKSQADTWLTLTQCGIPIANILRDEGWTEEDIDKMMEDANVTATVGNVPNLTRLPKATTDEGRAAVMDKAKAALETKAAPSVGASLDGATSKGVDAMIKNGSLVDMLAKSAGKQVRK